MAKLILIFLILILAGLFLNTSLNISYEKKRKYYVQLVIFILILQSGLRNWGVGPDTYQYYHIFNLTRHASLKELLYNFTHFEGKDPFYRVFIKIFQMFSDSYQVFLILVAVIFMTVLGNFILKNTTKIRHAALAFIIYMGYFYGFFSITGIRQTLATAFLLWSFEFIKKKKYIGFVVLVFIAGLFHISALVFLLVPFIINFKKPKLLLAASLFSLPIIFYFKNSFAIGLVTIFGMEDRFLNYTVQYHQGGSVIIDTFFILLGVISLVMYNKVESKNAAVSKFFPLYAVALVFIPLQWVNPSAGRIGMPFIVFAILMIPYLLEALGGKDITARKIIYVFTVVLFIILTTFTISSWDEYKFFWQYMPIPY